MEAAPTLGGIAAWKPLSHWAESLHGSRSHIGRYRSMEAALTLGGIAAWKPLPRYGGMSFFPLKSYKR